jgi:hypothetical protein
MKPTWQKLHREWAPSGEDEEGNPLAVECDWTEAMALGEVTLVRNVVRGDGRDYVSLCVVERPLGELLATPSEADPTESVSESEVIGHVAPHARHLRRGGWEFSAAADEWRLGDERLPELAAVALWDAGVRWDAHFARTFGACSWYVWGDKDLKGWPIWKHEDQVRDVRTTSEALEWLKERATRLTRHADDPWDTSTEDVTRTFCTLCHGEPITEPCPRCGARPDEPHAQHLREGGWQRVEADHDGAGWARFGPAGDCCSPVLKDDDARALYDAGARWCILPPPEAKELWGWRMEDGGGVHWSASTTYALQWLRRQAP